MASICYCSSQVIPLNSMYLFKISICTHSRWLKINILEVCPSPQSKHYPILSPSSLSFFILPIPETPSNFLFFNYLRNPTLIKTILVCATSFLTCFFFQVFLTIMSDFKSSQIFFLGSKMIISTICISTICS